MFRGKPPSATAPAPSVEPERRIPFRAGGLLDGPAGYDQIFSVVRAAVRAVLHKERPGLSLGLSDLPPQLGAYWPVTGNLIVMNEGLVEAMRRHAENPREFNSFVFVILMHEYLHTLGYLSERQVRPVTALVARQALGPEHPATKMAEGDLWQMFPFLQYAPQGHGARLRVVRGFDTDTTASYIR